MRLQISSGQGPTECELAVGKFLNSIIKEFKDIVVLEKVKGQNNGTYKSVIISTNKDLKLLDGSIKWICESPYRPKHKRKNWFIQVSIISDVKEKELDEKYIRFETFRCQGNGGQNVNKVESGVRVIYKPLNLITESTEERTQLMNKKIALKKLKLIIENINRDSKRNNKIECWKENMAIERGNAIRVYTGMNFTLGK